MLLLLAQRLLKRQGTVYPIHPLWPPRKPAPKGDSVMQTRRLGNTDLQFSRIGLGTWALGGGDWTFSWGAQDDAQSVETVCRALDLGVNWIDTAPVYGLGHSEEVVGKAIKGMSVKPLIATKCERCWDKDRKIYPCLKRESIRAEAEASLRRLGIDVIDLYQIHWPQPDADLEEGWATVAELVREGKVRYAGVSNFSLAQLQRIEPIHPVASLQPPYSMITRGVEAELLPYCHDHHIGVIVYSPMQKGLLTGKVTPQWVAQLPANDHRRLAGGGCLGASPSRGHRFHRGRPKAFPDRGDDSGRRLAALAGRPRCRRWSVGETPVCRLRSRRAWPTGSWACSERPDGPGHKDCCRPPDPPSTQSGTAGHRDVGEEAGDPSSHARLNLATPTQEPNEPVSHQTTRMVPSWAWAIEG